MIIPSIDLSGGKAVQLRQGRDKALEDGAPLALAERFARFGPLAVIDLDAAFGTGNNEGLIGELASRHECRVGGGIRTVEKAERMLDLGAGRVIVGTRAWTGSGLDAEFLGGLRKAAGRERLILALDSLDGEVVVEGWKKRTGVRVLDAVREAEEYVSGLLVTCVEREGLERGSDPEFYERLREATSMSITAAGGISSAEEVARLSRLDLDLQLGMAVYTGRLGLEEAFVSSLDWDKGLLPTVTVDEQDRVLMLAWSSRESLEKALNDGRAWYFSRSRNRLWQKGETSGDVQELLKARVDCDADTIKFTVRQTGRGACHKGSYSCFGGKEFLWGDLYEVVRDRLANAPAGSYTAGLTGRKLREKLIEEAGELAMAVERKEIVWEAADLLYFMTVLLAREGVEMREVLLELAGRRRKKGQGR